MEPYYKSFKIKDIIKHENYSAYSLQNDIAIIVPDGDIQDSNGVKPACVTKEMYKPGEMCVSLGWGPTHYGMLAPSKKGAHGFSDVMQANHVNDVKYDITVGNVKHASHTF